ncbi:DoxX family protein [Plantactinospora sp. CA-294935]|uniref:DoxX family protein n=1 Tax=Plantactinospora sp. CA-294935 TaxID=3240012 RepID=UPI003D8DA42A
MWSASGAPPPTWPGPSSCSPTPPRWAYHRPGCLPLAALKAAGAAGLLLGLLGVPVVGLAAAIGLVLFFVGAVTVHLRARVFRTLGYAGGFLALAVACLVLEVAVAR